MGDGGVSSFYEWTGKLPVAHGAMLREEALPSRQLPAHAALGRRILYTSISGVRRGDLTVVSGSVLLPGGTPPAGGWPIVSWAHGTTGIADVCAPSWKGRAPRDQAYLDAWLAKGFAIVATDYEGLGTPGAHPYLLYRSEGNSILDALRAALAEPTLHLRNEIVLLGQSQGAGAALGAAWILPQSGAGLHVRAAVLTGLVTGIATARTRQKAQIYSDPAKMDPGFAMLRFAGTDHSLHPEADLSSYVTPLGAKVLHAALTSCLHDVFDTVRSLGLTSGSQLFRRSIEPIDNDMEPNFTVPDGKVEIPIFVGTGLADNAAGTGGQYDAVAAMCAAGTRVDWRTYPGTTHNGTPGVSLADSIPYVEGVLAGRKAPEDCKSIREPGPLDKALPGVKFND